MTSRVERLLRWVWLINGVLLLGLLVVGLLFVSRQWILDLTVSADPVSLAPDRLEEAEPPAPVRHGVPRPIRGTDTRLVLIHRGPGPLVAAPLTPGSYDAGSGTGAPVVNVAFLEDGGGRLLLDRPAYVSAVRWPGEGGEARLRSILYEIAVDDANGDGRIDHRDPRALYVSDLGGRGLRRVLPAGFALLSWQVLDDGSVFVTALPERDGGGAEADRVPPRAFLVGPDGRVRPYAALDSLTAAAREVLR